VAKILDNDRQLNPDRSPVIGVMGGSLCDEEEEQLAFQTGREIAYRGAILLTGGMGGVMEAASRGAKENMGFVIAVLPGKNARSSPPNPYVDLPVYTGLAEGRNLVNVLTSDVIIAIGGGWGTLSEIALARRVQKEVIMLKSWNISHKKFPVDGIFEVQSAKEAVEEAFARIKGFKI